MHIFTEEQYDEIEKESNPAVRKYLSAKLLAQQGIQVFPARAYDEAAFIKAHEEWKEDKRIAKEQGTKPKLNQSHYKKHGGKGPAIRDQYTKASCALAQIEKWWHPTKGEFRGNNVCISTGRDSGLVVVDLDVKPDEGVDGFLWWNELIAQHGDVNTFRVRTGGHASGGQHIYFKWREGTQICNGLAPGVDIRTDGGEDGGKKLGSHVVGPFSECQGSYEVICFDEVAEMPDWLYDLVSGKGKASQGEQEAEAKNFDQTPLDQIEEMLDYLDPNHPDVDAKWKTIMYAIHSEHPTPEGLAVLQRWSARNEERFDEADNADLWDRANSSRTNGAKIGSLYALAEEYGWVNPKRTAIDLDLSTAIRMMNRSYAVIDPDRCVADLARRGKQLDYAHLPPSTIPPMTIFKTKTIFGMEGNREHRYMKLMELGPMTVKLSTSHYRVRAEMINGKMGKPSSVFDRWITSPARKSFYTAGYYLNSKRVPEGVLNLFPGFAVEPKALPKPRGVDKSPMPPMFAKHLLEITCSGDERRFTWLINRLAYVVQYGDRIVPTALAITGEQGSGKTIIGDYMGRVLGRYSYLELANADALESRFSEELVGKFIICADEAIFAGDPKLRNKLKSMISSNVIRDEGKGKAAKEAQNVMFLMVLSNEDEPVSIERGDRRFTVMKTNNKFSKLSREKDPEVDKAARDYFKQLAAEMKGDGPANLLHFLLNYEVDTQMARESLDTQEKQVMAEKRVLKCDSMVAFLYYILVSGVFEVEDDDGGNTPEERWGGRSRTGAFYERYKEWVAGNRQRNSEWKAEVLSHFPKRLVDEFGCMIIKPANKSTILWPSREVMVEALRTHIPEAIADWEECGADAVDKYDQLGGSKANGTYDASKETDF